MAEDSTRQQSLTPEQTERLLRLLTSVFEKKGRLHFSSPALRILYDAFGRRLLRAMEEGNVDRMLDVWERDRSKFVVNVESRARRYPRYEPFPPFSLVRILDERGMDYVLAQCKRDKLDIE